MLPLILPIWKSYILSIFSKHCMSQTEPVLLGEGQGLVSAAFGRDMFGNLSTHSLVLCLSLLKRPYLVQTVDTLFELPANITIHNPCLKEAHLTQVFSTYGPSQASCA